MRKHKYFAAIKSEWLVIVLNLKDIAEELGLSVSTVSRAINNTGRMSEKTRKKILEAVERYNYIPNDIARSLRLKNGSSVGIITSDITNNFYANVVKGAQSVLRENDLTLFVCNSDEDPQLEEEALATLLSKQISGLILASVGGNSEGIQQLYQLGIPVVFIDNIPNDQEKYDSVSIDNVNAAIKLTEQLIGRGYKDIGMITGALNQSTGYDRLKGFKIAMENASLPIIEDWIIKGDFKKFSGRQAMKQLLALNSPPKAVVIANNYMAYGAVSALRKQKLTIPQDMALVAFDAIDDTGLISPKITSMNQDSVEVGIQAATILLDKIKNKQPKCVYQNLILKPSLYDGESW